VYEDQWIEDLKAHPDKNIRIFSDRVRYANSETGDYIHLNFRNRNGDLLSFFASDDRITYFCLAHKSRWIEIRYEKLDRWIPEAHGYHPIERIVFAKIQHYSFDLWWKAECKKLTTPGAEKKHENILQKELYPDLQH